MYLVVVVVVGDCDGGDDDGVDFYYFIMEFNLVEKRELAPLQDLIDRLTGTTSTTTSST
jgi:hypothetical protein